ncbi:related to cis-1,2-dihydro-1,2-dihydroxynaphthalene dehydrogenase [Ramularia collo-cygni]|uniref:Related to cis-1,2-dihydro-1,2-dihydroxynaphthalene dehydrogenase n=1 Tax=Ramularia collo-cygni TaxID=112498 RepID=A0A2D3VQT5_9PEZI|nr:related to cis-1,2-dihydro-1,2-dihydroxynaphthalene dehydrogenase [Ramularia collo-cygni]CZT25779.1 related to cis-1,2-dihydro-1,2-dihydroxynaphthalene dehydrogenase [Ramularia collo-cygni]
MTTIQKVALVTAGTAGLGAAICHSLARSGFRLAINFANNEGRAKNLIEELNKIPSSNGTSDSPRFESFRADVGDRPAVQKLVQDTVTTFGRIDVVVSNAGWTRITNFQNLEEGMVDEDWDKCFIYNVKSHLWLLHAAKFELEKSEGAFITSASIAGVKPTGSSLPYAVTKAAAIHLSKALAAICSPKVRVNSISPGLLLTEWGMKFPEEKREAAREATQLKRLATVEDCAEQVRALALSQSMTGQNIIIDGGASL